MARYLTTTMRFVPRPASGEFVNVGAIAGSDDAADWHASYVSNLRRARAIDDAGIAKSVLSTIAAIQAEVEDYGLAIDRSQQPESDISEAWLESLHGRYRRTLQFSAPKPIIADSAEDAVRMVFEHEIVDYESKKHPFRTKQSVFSTLLRAYSAAGLRKGTTLRQHAEVRSTHAAKFDFAVANGVAVQLSHALSFVTPKIGEMVDDMKSWAWSVQDLRQHGGDLWAKGSNTGVRVPRDVDIEVLYVPPSDDVGRDALKELQEAFQKIDVTARPEGDESKIAAQARALLPGLP